MYNEKEEWKSFSYEIEYFTQYNNILQKLTDLEEKISSCGILTDGIHKKYDELILHVPEQEIRIQTQKIEDLNKMSIIAYCKADDGIVLGCDSRTMDINKNIRQNDAIKYYVNKEKGIAVVIAGYLDVCKIADKDKPVETTVFYPLIPLLDEVCNKMDACSMEAFMYGYNDLSKEYDLRNTQMYVVFASDQILVKQDFHDTVKKLHIEYTVPFIEAMGSTNFSIIPYWSYYTNNKDYSGSISLPDAAKIIRAYIKGNIALQETILKEIDSPFVSDVGGDIHIISIHSNGEIEIS